MKNSIRFLLGLLLLIPICATSSGTGVSHKAPKPDTFDYAFGYTVTPDPGVPGVYNLALYFLILDIDNLTWTLVACPSAISVTCTTGPRIGTIAFPVGLSSVSLGNTTTIPAAEYPISTSPTTLSGRAVYQEAIEITM